MGRVWPLLLQKHHRVFVNLSSDTFAKDSQLRDIFQCCKLQQAIRKFNSIPSVGKSPVNIADARSDIKALKVRNLFIY
jgi:hypothetical protein